MMDHDTLLQVLDMFGVKVTTMNWFDSYLADQKQSFQQRAQRSGPHLISCSVPQGSVLRPQEL